MSRKTLLFFAFIYIALRFVAPFAKAQDTNPAPPPSFLEQLLEKKSQQKINKLIPSALREVRDFSQTSEIKDAKEKVAKLQSFLDKLEEIKESFYQESSEDQEKRRIADYNATQLEKRFADMKKTKPQIGEKEYEKRKINWEEQYGSSRRWA